MTHTSCKCQSEKGENNLHNKILLENGPCLYLKNDSGILESMYSSIRNALAHGDFICRNDYFEFFSVKANKGENILDGRITFFLRIKRLEDLEGFLKIQKYLQ